MRAAAMARALDDGLAVRVVLRVRCVRLARDGLPRDLVVLSRVPEQPARRAGITAGLDLALDVIGPVRRRLVTHRLEPGTDLRAAGDATFGDRLLDVLHAEADELGMIAGRVVAE